MGMLQRADVPAGTAVRQEVVTLASLGGDVIVRGRMLADTMLLLAMRRQGRDDKEADDEDAPADPQRAERDMRRGVKVICETLHLQVVLEDGAPMWSAEQWEQHGAAHPNELLRLFGVAERLAGADIEAVAKN